MAISSRSPGVRRVGLVQQDVRKLAHGLCGFGTKGEAGGDAGRVLREGKCGA